MLRAVRAVTRKSLVAAKQMIDNLIAAGLEGFNPLEPRCGLDLTRLRERYAKIVFLGGVCNTQILPPRQQGRDRRPHSSIDRIGP